MTEPLCYICGRLKSEHQPYHPPAVRCQECGGIVDQTALVCFALGPPVGYYHPECYRKARQKRLALEMTPRQRMDKGYDYYDLIELPTGEHIPVPIAKKLVGKEILASVPADETKTRGDRFFFCQACCDELSYPVVYGDIRAYSFFRCQQHKPTTKQETDRKEAYLVQLILLGNYRKLKYIRATRTRVM